MALESIQIKSRSFQRFNHISRFIEHYIQKIILEAMTNDKNKVVDNYCLQELRQIYPNQTQLWNVRHKILKKVFTLKKLKYRSGTTPNEKNNQAPILQFIDQYQKLVNQTNLLKRLNDQFAPKCYKMIKTSNNVYLVYQQFPSLTLKQYISKHPLNNHERNTLLQNLALAVMQTHSKQIAILNLNQNNIYVKEKLQVFFGDWTLSKCIGSKQKIGLLNYCQNNQFIANEVKQQGQYGLWSDIYSLGKIFKIIQNSCVLQANSSFNKRLQALIIKMTSRNYNQRPCIKQVTNAINLKLDEIQTKKFTSSNLKQQLGDYKLKSNLKLRHAGTCQENSFHDITRSRLKSIRSVERLLTQKDLDSTKNYPYDTFQTPKQAIFKFQSSYKSSNNSNNSLLSMKKPNSSNCLNQYQSLSQNRSSRNSQRMGDSHQKIFKTANKYRNLSFLLVDLSELVLRSQSNNELGFMLLKYSYLTYRQNMQKWINQRDFTAQGAQLTQILQKELSVIANIMMRVKLQLKQQARYKISLKRQLEIDHLINDKYLRQKILQFAKEVVINYENNQLQRLFSVNQIDVLFKTYLILKKVQEGSFQKFWDKVSNENNAYLSNQKYLKDQKSLGFRYLKSRIAEILSKK